MVNIMVNTTQVLFAVGNAVAFALGAYLFLNRGPITIGTVFIIAGTATCSCGPSAASPARCKNLQQAGASITRIRELLAIESKIEDARADASIRALPDGALAVSFQNVSFGYDDAETKDSAQGQRRLRPPHRNKQRPKRNTQHGTRNTQHATQKTSSSTTSRSTSARAPCWACWGARAAARPR